MNISEMGGEKVSGRIPAESVIPSEYVSKAPAHNILRPAVQIIAIWAAVELTNKTISFAAFITTQWMTLNKIVGPSLLGYLFSYILSLICQAFILSYCLRLLREGERPLKGLSTSLKVTGAVNIMAATFAAIVSLMLVGKTPWARLLVSTIEGIVESFVVGTAYFLIAAVIDRLAKSDPVANTAELHR